MTENNGDLSKSHEDLKMYHQHGWECLMDPSPIGAQAVQI